jgi:spore germination protein KA
MKYLRKPKLIRAKYKNKITRLQADSVLSQGRIPDTLSTDISKNEQVLREIFKNCSDVVYRTLEFMEQPKILLIYIDGLPDVKHLDESLLKSFVYDELLHNSCDLKGLGKLLVSQSLPIGETRVVQDLHEVVKKILKGDIAILVAGEAHALLTSMEGWAKRAIEEPASEQVIRGPREGFIETIRVNTGLIRRRIQTPKLKMESLTIGETTATDVVIVYIEGIVLNSVLSEVRQRLGRIQIDGILESGYIEEFIKDSPFSIFPTIQNTERPDVVAANLLEGKVAILVDGTPFALVVPMTFWAAFQANEDYYQGFIFASAIRFIRLVFMIIALILPSLFVALVSFQQEMLPTPFLLTIADSQEATPFPAVVEAFMMEFMFEGLREAGVRLPKAVGSAISIVGALVIGDAAVQAGIVSAPMVIIVAITGIASFTIPRYNLGIAIRLLRFPLLFMAGTFGLFGIALGLIAILLLLVSTRTFGIPYYSPLAPLTVRGLRDVIIRAPWWTQTDRPQTAKHEHAARIPSGQMPKP